MPQTHSYTSYSFKELSDTAKEKALNDNRDILTEPFSWWELVYEDWQEKLKALGYSEPEIEFSGFYSQGDGASFTSPVDIKQWLKAHKLGNTYKFFALHADEYSFCIERCHWHGYVHSNTIDSRCDDSWMACYHEQRDNERLLMRKDDLLALLKEEARQLSQDIYRDLKQEYENLTSNETLTEFFTESDTQFTESGGGVIYVA